MTQKTLCALLLLLSPLLAVPASADVAPNGLVILFTDYGADSIYVGALKGAIYAAFPQARIDTITHSVPPFDVLSGAYMLVEAAKEFPPGTTFCCVVDPGVGTPRKRIVLETRNGLRFVAPDNGLLTLAADQFGVAAIREAANTALWRPGEVSNTFQGRDIFGPVAAALARGVPLADVGPERDGLVRLDIAPARIADGVAHGVVTRADPYGNLVTNITPGMLNELGLALHDTARITIGKAEFRAPLESTYAAVPPGERLLVIQSSGYVECAINLGSLAEAIGEGAHAPVRIQKAP